MGENCIQSFILNNSCAAVSALPTEDATYATDGTSCLIYSFSSDGTHCGEVCTVRPYRRLRRNLDTGMTTALGCCNLNRIYFLTDCFTECCYTELDTECEHTCECRCMCEDMTELTDASLTVIGGETFITAAFRKCAYLFDMDGKRKTRICVADGDEILTDFIYPRDGLYVMGTRKNNRFTVTVSDDGILHSAVLNTSHTLRQLFYENGAVYALFGRNYIYNRILRIYENGILRLPD